MITWWDLTRPYQIWFTPPTMNWSDALDAAGAREKQWARDLMESRPLRHRVPDPSLLAWGQTDKVDHLEACRGVGYAYVYTPTGKNLAVNLGRISGDAVRAWWFDPRTGAATEIGSYPNRGSRTFDPPGEPRLGNDWILVLDDKARNYPPPGSQDDPQTADAQDEPVRAPGPAIAAHPPAPGSELLVNGSFEDGATAWLLNGAELVPDAGMPAPLPWRSGKAPGRRPNSESPPGRTPATPCRATCAPSNAVPPSASSPCSWTSSAVSSAGGWCHRPYGGQPSASATAFKPTLPPKPASWMCGCTPARAARARRSSMNSGSSRSGDRAYLLIYGLALRSHYHP